ncbi:HAD-IIA family hydrolase [Rothia sp. AR01]|uniref:HAD-IIA family hydrolase n=1 Tax=Rothia santali TaxID=2949643 RepID=A0A9X2HF00_9MICC|nr:HAD-IIA family hydrolase [Rothia santali]MCP3426875.1 HAD-IIA family hydrolase [Rothia santali]
MDRSHITSWLTDMDGVLVQENKALPGAAELLQQWRREDAPYLVLTNNSIFTARDLSARLRASGLIVPEERIWTSALATADFLAKQMPGGSVFVIGEAGMTTALHEAGFIMTETDPDYVVIGETRNYSFEAITKAIRLINTGSRFIATNPDATGPSADGVLPATGAISALITKATGRIPYVVGKPNPMMFRSALNRIGAHSETTAMIGDRMDTDVVAGIEAGLHTILTLTGISDEAAIQRYPFRPTEVISGVGELVHPRDGEARDAGGDAASPPAAPGADSDSDAAGSGE